MLRGETLVAPQELLSTARTVPHGHVEAILAMIRRLGLERVTAIPKGLDSVYQIWFTRLDTCPPKLI